MTTHRFHYPQLSNQPLQLLDGAEAHHAIRVLRVRVGDPVELFDGEGNLASGVIDSLQKRELLIRIARFQFAPLDSDGMLHFAIALPKGDRQRSVLEKLVELGVDSVIPISTRFSVAEVDEGNIDRLVRYSLEACKQCGRNRNLVVHAPQEMRDFYSTIRAKTEQGFDVRILHPTNEALPEKPQAIPRSKELLDASNKPPTSTASAQTPRTPILFIVGPEGGFTEEEVLASVAAGAAVLGLGARILRVETAVTVAATLGQFELGHFEFPAKGLSQEAHL